MTTEPFVADADLHPVVVTGADRLTYLDAVLSQALADLPAGTWRGALELDPHGAPRAVLDVVALADRVLLLVPTAALADDVTERLGGRTFLQDATFTPSDDGVVSLRGAGAATVAERAGFDAAPGAARERGEVVVVGRDVGVDLVGPTGALPAARQALLDAGAEAATAEQLEAWRVAAGRPRWQREVVAPHLPEELGLLPTHVHLAKGCYPGQEAVARMWMLGRPRRVLARVAVDGDVAAGWRTGSGREAVEVTSVARWDGRQVGLAFVPATASPGSRYTGEDGAVEVEQVVGSGSDVPGHEPNVARRRDRTRAGADG